MINYTGTDLEEMNDKELFELAAKREARYILVPTGETIEINGMKIPNKIPSNTFPYEGPELEEIKAEKAKRIAAKHELGEDSEEFVKMRNELIGGKITRVGTDPELDALDALYDRTEEAIKELSDFYKDTWEAGKELAGEVLARALHNVRSLNIEPNAVSR